MVRVENVEGRSKATSAFINSLVDDYARRVQVPLSYAVYQEDSTYYAEHCLTSSNDHSGTNAATVIQYALDHAPDFSRVHCNGSITITNGLTIDPNKHLWFSFESLYGNGNFTVLTVDGGASTVHTQGRITGGRLRFSASSTTSVLKLRNVALQDVDIRMFDTGAGLAGVGSVCVHILGDGGGSSSNIIRLGMVHDARTAILLESASSGWATLNKIYDGDIGVVETGVKLLNNGVNTSGNQFLDVSVSQATTYGFWNTDEDNVYFNCRTVDSPATITADFRHDGTHVFIWGGQFSQSKFVNNGSGAIIRDVRLFVTENSGSDSIANGTTSKVVAHGLNVTPSAEHFTIIGKENPTNDVGTIWVDNIGATNFTVNVENDPGGSNWDFGWNVKVS